MSFSGYVNKVPGGDLIPTLFTLNGVNVDDDDDDDNIVGHKSEMSNSDV